MDRDNGISTWSLAAIVWLTLVITLGIVSRDTYFSQPFLETADAAVNGIKVEHARHFTELYGNYSRFYFNHPGPVFYYVYALGELVLRDLLGVCPDPGNVHLVTIMALQSAFFALAVAMFGSSWRRPAWLPLALLGAALQFGSVRGAFVSTWPPDVLLMPSLAFLVACISVACGRLDHLLVMVLAGGLLFHGHVAQSLFVGTLAPLALAMNLSRHRRAAGTWSLRQWFSGHRTIWIAAGVLVGLFLLPLVIDVICYGRHSNVGTILSRFEVNTGDAKDPWQSLLYFLSFATSAQNQEELFTVIGPATRALFAENAVRLAVWGVIWFAPPVALWAFRRHLTPRDLVFLATGSLFLACTAGLCLLWGMAQAAEMFNFNGIFYYGVFYLALMLALALVSLAIDRWYRPAAAAVVVAVAAVLLSSQKVISLGGNDLEIRKAVENALAGENVSGPRFLAFDNEAWPIGAAVALELERRGVGFRVSPWWSFMFGRQHELAYSADERLAVWWITPPAPDGLPLTDKLSLYRLAAPIQPEGDEVRFNYADNGFRYLVSGLGFGGADSAWTNLPRVCFQFATPPAKQDVCIVFDASTSEVKDDKLVSQAAEVLFNGVHIARVELLERREAAIRVPADLWNRAPSALLELHFPASFVHREPGRPGYEPRGAWRLFALRFRPAP